MMQKLMPQLSGELGETLALAKFVSVGLHAYVSPPGAPGHDIIVVSPEGSKSIEVKTRQYIDSPTEISRWPVDMNTKANADYFLFIELNLRTFEPTFYLLNNDQTKAAHKDYSGSGNCIPKQVRTLVQANDFSALTGEFSKPTVVKNVQSEISKPQSKQETTDVRQTIIQEAEIDGHRVVQYSCQSIDVFVKGVLQNNAIENLRHIAKKVGVSERNGSMGVRNTRQLGKAVIEAIKARY